MGCLKMYIYIFLMLRLMALERDRFGFVKVIVNDEK